MNVAINCIPLLTPRTGVGQYTYHLARCLKAIAPHSRYWYFYGRFSHHLAAAHKKQNAQMAQAIKTVKRLPFAARLGRKARGWLARLCHPGIAFDLYLEPNFIPLAEIEARRLLTVVHDFSFKRHPEWHPRDRMDFFSRHFEAGIARSDGIAVDSGFTRTEGEGFGIPARRMRVVYPGYEAEVFRPLPEEETRSVRSRYRLPDRFLFFVGSVEPRKNLRGLLDAYARLAPDLRRDLALVICGPEGWLEGGLIQKIKSGGIPGTIRFIGYVDDAELAAVYNLAQAFVYPTFYEGFGLPPLEAMACGCPVVTSRVASVPEVCGDAVLYCNPFDPGSIADAVTRAATSRDLRSELREKGLARARFFSWTRTAQGILDLCRDLG